MGLYLILNNPDQKNLKNFLNYLIEIIETALIDTSVINAKLNVKYCNYLNILYPGYNWDLRSIFFNYFKNLTIIDYKNKYKLTVDKNTSLHNVPLQTLANIITYGTLDIKGTSIFIEEYNKIADYIPILYQIWRAR